MTDPTLREYIETVINLRCELLDNKIQEAQSALKLQAKEYERRLLTLNHEAEQLKEMRASSVTRELFDSNQKELMRRISELELSKSNLEGKASQKSVMIAWIISGIGLLIAIVSFIKG